MRTAPSPVPRSRFAPPPSAACPPRHALDDASVDVWQLAADIDRILSAQSSGLALRLGAVRSAARPDLPQARRNDTHHGGFEWLAEGPPWAAGSAPAGSTRGAEQAAEWLRKAKRDRRLDRCRHAASWLLALSVAGAIASLSLYVLLGRVPGADDVLTLARTLGL